MSILETLLARQLWARRHRADGGFGMDDDVVGGRALVVRGMAAFAIVAVTVAALDFAADGSRQMDMARSSVAASRQ